MSKNVASFVSEVRNLMYIAGSPLSGSNDIFLGWTAADYLNIPDEMTNNGDLFELSSLSSPYFFFLNDGVL